jgi:NADPH2:quinone reductase
LDLSAGFLRGTLTALCCYVNQHIQRIEHLKAIVCESFGPPESLVLKDAAPPAIKSRHIRVRVQYCSVNFPDALMIQGQHQYKHEPPFIPGGEISGIVSELGPDAEGFAVGDPVAALTYYGGFAEEAVVPMERVCKLPAGLDMSEACCLVGTYGTAIHALAQRAQLCAGETLLVLGAAGGSGAAAVQVGKLMGAHVIAAVGSDAKLEFSLMCGADEGFNYTATPIRDALRSLTGQRGIDVIYDPVGGAYSESALRSMAWNGRHLVIGFAAGTIPAFRANLPLLKGCAIVGVFAGEFMTREPLKAKANTVQLLEWVASGRLHPAVREIVPLELTSAALRKLLDREAMGKIIVSIGSAK